MVESMDGEKGKYQYAALKWLYEMELVNDPQLINNLKLNIFSVSKHIRETELLISQHHKQILVYLQLGWVGRKFFKNDISLDAKELVMDLLPSFTVRVVADRDIFDQALANVRQAIASAQNKILKEEVNAQSTLGLSVDSPNLNPESGDK